jgi:hypothetical protein
VDSYDPMTGRNKGAIVADFAEVEKEVWDFFEFTLIFLILKFF